MIGRVNAGGGGGLQGTDAILRVIAPAGSTVTISKGGVSKSDLGHENAIDPTLYDYYFIIHQTQFDSINAWTVTATIGTATASDTIIIDSADEYDMTLLVLYIVQNGFVQTGWIAHLAGISSGAISQGDGYLEHTVPKVGSSYSQLYFTPKHTFPSFHYLVYDGQQKGYWYNNPPCPSFGVATSTIASGSDGGSWSAIVATRDSRYDTYANRDKYVLDVSNVSGTYWIASLIASSSSQNVTGGERIYNLYLTDVMPE